jgi:chromatin licensing and DNA replication factor 1
MSAKSFTHALEFDNGFLRSRKFLYTHLAQMKHLFPEAIQITRILLHDEKSICMYADMEITFRMDTVECSNSHESPAMAICEAFRSKLLCFLESHHEVLNLVQLLVFFIVFCL